MDRRQFVTVAGSVIGAAVAAALARAPLAAEAASAQTPAARLDALFDAFMDERLNRRPQLVTSLGLDTGKYAWAKASWVTPRLPACARTSVRAPGSSSVSRPSTATR